MRAISYASELDELRDGFGLSERELADALGTTPRTLRRWSAEDSVPGPASREHIEDLLQLLTALRGTIRARSIPKWIRRRVDLLSGRRPAELLVERDIEQLLDLADGLRTGAFA